MATISGIRGMLLEEAILFLLRNSGYTTILDNSKDPDLINIGPSGLELKGRGGVHQIDAIADFCIAPPFSYPQRLLVEAKCYSEQYKAGIGIARNAVGVLKDVNEYWTARDSGITKNRYHYQYSIFSATGFTDDAERYAYAHDIYLMNLHTSEYIKPIIQAIGNISYLDFNAQSRYKIDIEQKELRKYVRSKLRDISISDNDLSSRVRDALEPFFERCSILGYAYFATLGRRIPVFLTPSPQFRVESLSHDTIIKIMWNDEKWFIEDNNERKLFSFDLPLELFKEYQRDGLIAPRIALDMKKQHMSSIQLFIGRDKLNYEQNLEEDNIRIIELKLNIEWLNQVIENNFNGNSIG